MDDSFFEAARSQMLEIVGAHALLVAERTGRARLDERVLGAMAKVRRHEFVPLELQPVAYEDTPLPVGCGKTISQPFINALMTDLLDVGPAHTVLEIGTGLGYHAALLAELAAQVYSVEIIGELAEEGRKRLAGQGYTNVTTRIGDGNYGWPEHAPFDRILVAAAPELVPGALFAQLKPGGRMVVPAGLADAQQLTLVEKDAGGKLRLTEILPVGFAPLMTAEDLD